MPDKTRVEPGPGQESVWDYPRPAVIEPVKDRLKILFAGKVLAETTRGYRALETSHPPVYYFPPEDVDEAMLRAESQTSFCEWKGRARYVSVVAGERVAKLAGFAYDDPTPSFRPIAGYYSFYAGPMDAVFVGEEQARPQPGRFYSGWITDAVVGPFKGEPGTEFW